MEKRKLGKSQIGISAMGLGCWAIGGPFMMNGKADGWGDVDDNESIRAILRAYDLGVTFFDTADVYGIGRSERVLGKALKDIRDKVIIATKFGYTYDASTNSIVDKNVAPAYIRKACEASLHRLGTDYIDLYQLHEGSVSVETAEEVFDTLESLKKEGHIRFYGWSTDSLDRTKAFASKPNFVAVQHQLNIFHDTTNVLKLCKRENLASINRSPLAMGFLTGKFNADSRLSSEDVRGSGHSWVTYFEKGRPKQEFLDKLDAVREILTSNGRTVVQGALAWIWGKSQATIPIPGFKTVQQVEENAKAMDFGELTADQCLEIESIIRS